MGAEAQNNLSPEQRARYLALEQRRELIMSRRLSRNINIIRKRIIIMHRDLGPALKEFFATRTRGPVNPLVLQQQLRFMKLILQALRMPGLAMPSFAGISLTSAMRALIRKILRKKLQIWLFQLDQLRFANEKAMVDRGQKATQKLWLNNNFVDLGKAKEIIRTGKENVASQHNDYIKDRIGHWSKAIVDGRSHARGLFNAMAS